ncbi:MAG: hypothetical protein HKN44_11530, partial [Ilumatobacter sp.]|nr:hypothetical protein [Ilumatobacter sp.]
MQTEQLPPPRAQAAPPNLAPEAPARDGTRIPTLSAAGWLAATGAALLLAASVVVVAGQWQAITPEIRFAGLIAALLAVYFVAEAGRPRYPSTSTALATLAATMTAPVGVAAAATLDQPWPVCIVTGGLAALVAAEVQSRRWSVTVLKAATIAAVGLAASGVAAMTGTPVALWVAGAAVVALAAGAWRRSVVLGVAVGCSPVLLALSDAGIGPGTLARMGATGPSLRWSAPLAAVVAAAVIGIAAHRRSELALVALAAATFTSGLLVGVAHRDVGAIAWWSLPALVLLVVEAVAVVGRRSVWGSA